MATTSSMDLVALVREHLAEAHPDLGHVHGRGVLSRAVAGLDEVLAERRPPCDPY
jgi:hypothetical protein